jgi:hypothetical protein
VPTPPASLACRPLTDDFGWSRVEINVAMTVNFVVYSLMGPVVGWALDKHGARRVISDCHFAVQLNHFIPGFLSYSVAGFLK